MDMLNLFSFHHRLHHPKNGQPLILNPVTGEPASSHVTKH
jgi:hypothetical protein